MEDNATYAVTLPVVYNPDLDYSIRYPVNLNVKWRAAVLPLRVLDYIGRRLVIFDVMISSSFV